MEQTQPLRGIEQVLRRNLFYEKAYRELCILITLLLGLIVLLTCLITYQRASWPRPVYFATDTGDRPLSIVRLDEPYYQDSNLVLDWATNAVLAIYAMDYVTWRQTLQNAADYFVPAGYQAFMRALQASTNLEAIKAKRQVVSASVTGESSVVRAGQLSPELPYSWDLKIPLLVIYQNSANEIIKQSGTILARVERTSLLRYKDGIAFSQLILQTDS